MFAVAASAVVGKYLEDVAACKAQRKTTDCINDNCLNPRRAILKLAVERRGTEVETAFACCVPIVRLIAGGLAIAITARNKYRRWPSKAPRTLDVQCPLANRPSAASAVWQFSHLPEVDP